MPINLDDPRIKKTRRSLRAALIRLIMQEGYDAISIKDIAEEAETARITFYRHYRDKNDLLQDCLNELYEALVAKTEQEIAEGAPYGASPIAAFYEHLQEQEPLYQILLSSLGAQPVMERMKRYMADRVMETMDALRTETESQIPKEIVANHLVSAQMGLGFWWLKHQKPYPIDYMVQAAMSLSFYGVAGCPENSEKASI